MSQQSSTSDTLRNAMLAIAVFLTVMMVGPKLLPPPKPPAQEAPGATPGAPQAPRIAPGAAGQSVVTATPGAVPHASGVSDAGFQIIEAQTEANVTIGSAPDIASEDHAADPYRMCLTLSNVGAAIESATMTDHAESLGSEDRYQLLSTLESADGRRFRSLAIEKINIDKVDLFLHDKQWTLKTWTVDGEAQPWRETRIEGQAGQAVEFTIDVTHNGREALRLTRRYFLPQQTVASGRHDLITELQVDNLTDERSYPVGITYRGGLGIPQADTRIDDRAVDAGILTDGTSVTGARQRQATVITKQSISLYSVSSAGSEEQFSWAATENKYFTCTLAPLTPRWEDGRGVAAGSVAGAEAIDVDGDSSTDNDATTRIIARVEAIPPGGRLTYPVDVYLGEKDAKSFREVEEYRTRNYYFQVVQGYGWCTFTWLVELMIWLLNGLHWIVRDFGVAIIILVLIVRTMLHPITKKGQINMVTMQQRMGEFAPKIEELKKKYANDKAKLQQETMKLYREGNVNPATQGLSCLPMFLQMPIWVALYISLNNNILMRHESFLFTWIQDLTGPDALYTFATPVVVPLLGWVLPSFNLLPILVGISMYTQQKFQPKPKPKPNASDQQKQQQEMMQKMMPMMSVMMLVIFYKMPSGLNLYIMASSFFGTYEQFRIRKHIKEREAAGTLHKPAANAETGPKRPGKPSFFQKLAAMAEEAKKPQPPNRGKPRRK